MLAAELKKRLGIRARAFVSDPAAVADAHLQIATDETLQLAGTHNADAILLDIAFYRYLLLVEQNGVDEAQFNAYRSALKQVADPTNQSNIVAHARSQSRANKYV